jgi:hypothetical protein
MMKLKKILVLGVILLFIGVAIAPSINFNVVKASKDNDLVEVTTQACGIKGYGNTTVKLTKQQYQNLEQYLVEFRARLNQTSTRDEAVPLFKEAVVELNKYGLLPKGMSVEQAQRLVVGSQNKGLSHLMEKNSLRNQINDLNNSNYLCLLVSATDGLISVGPIVRWSCNMMYLLFELEYVTDLIQSLYENGHIIISNILSYITVGILLLSIFPSTFGIVLTSANPLKVFYTIALGDYLFNPNLYEYQYTPSSGWVATFGLNGKKIFQDQPLWGNLPLLPIHQIFYLDGWLYPGIFGFTGIQILRGEEKGMFLLGSALWVEIGSEPPQ